MTSRWEELVDDPAINILVELMGGIDTPYQFVMRALDAGKVVVTGNKALLAERGFEIFEKAADKGVPIFFEAAVAGGIPIIKSIREGFIGNHIESIHAILNGTSNYILSRMTEESMDFPEALREAQEQGYAEADPTLDVNGWDAAHKAIILASLAYGFWVNTNQIHVAGIDKSMRPISDLRTDWDTESNWSPPSEPTATASLKCTFIRPSYRSSMFWLP